MAKDPRILIVDGYAKDGREGLRDGGATTAGELYAKMLAKCCPGLESDIVYPADPGAGLPSGAAIDQYDGIAWTGSSLTVHKPDPQVTPQIEFACAAYEAKVPGFGSCWAAQIAVVAAGGQCRENPKGLWIQCQRAYKELPRPMIRTAPKTQRILPGVSARRLANR